MTASCNTVPLGSWYHVAPVSFTVPAPADAGPPPRVPATSPSAREPRRPAPGWTPAARSRSPDRGRPRRSPAGPGRRSADPGAAWPLARPPRPLPSAGRRGRSPDPAEKDPSPSGHVLLAGCLRMQDDAAGPPPSHRRSPHARGDALLLLADRVGVDRSRGELGVAEPLLHHVQRDAPGDGLHAEAVPQALGAGVRTVGDIRSGDDLLDPPVR